MRIRIFAWKTFAVAVSAVLFCVMAVPAAFADDKDLAKKSQNPVGNIISVPIEWFHYGDMPNDSNADVVMIKPVYPVNLGSYNLINGWYLTTSPTNTADWEKSSSDRWTVPLGGGVGKIMRFGKQPVDFKLQAYSNIEKPDGGPDWTTMYAVKLLFPK